jgi:hypothetical protein
MPESKTYYTLETHLQEAAKANPQFDLLNAIWKLNKGNLASALSNITQYYPHFSLHDSSHSETIVRNIESFLGEDRIKTLSPTDTWLLLMATFTHDLGMIVIQGMIENQWPSAEFQDFLQELSNRDDDLKAPSELLLRVQALGKTPLVESIKQFSPIEVKNSVILVVAEYVRRVHHQRSADILSGRDKSFFDLALSFYSNQIPNRLLSILAEVAYLHGVEFYELFSRLDYQGNGVAGDKIHPRFVASMLRLGDLLDVDNNRFNLFSAAVFKYPSTSELHKAKHSSIKHLLITPEAIEITCDCATDDVYRISRNWFDWLENEIANQSKEWSNIAPRDLGGSSPTIPRNKIRVYSNGGNTDSRLLNLRFQISNAKTFQIIEGSSLYDESQLTFLRELIQNSLDASKIQLWKEIEDGTYDHLFESLGTPNDNLSTTINFPSDLPDNLLNSIRVSVVFEWADDAKDKIVVTVEDNGTGISNDELVRMTSRVGEKAKGREKDELIRRMPFWMKPTAAFGVGLQSLFIVSEEFTVQTKADGEASKEIIFRSAKRNRYSSLTSNRPKMRRGTRTILNVPKEKFSQVFGSTFSMNITFDYDYFTDEHKSIYIRKLEDYVENLIKVLPNVKVSFFGKPLGGKRSGLETELVSDKPEYSKSGEIQGQLHMQGDALVFHFYESVIGSEFLLHFYADAEAVRKRDGYPRGSSTQYFVRNIPVKDNSAYYYKLFYAGLTWNFTSPDSDALLTLTRDKFIRHKKIHYENIFLKEILPEALNVVGALFERSFVLLQKHFEADKDKLAWTYFKIRLLKEINLPSSEHLDNRFFLSQTLMKEIAAKFDGTPFEYAEFFDATDFLILVPNTNGSEARVDSARESLLRQVGKVEGTPAIVHHASFLSQYLVNHFRISKLWIFGDGKVLQMRRDSEPPDKISLMTDPKQYLIQLLMQGGRNNRGIYYSVEKYSKGLSVKNIYHTGFEDFPYLSNSSIISPFKDKRSYENLRARVLSVVPPRQRDQVEAFLTDNVLAEVIPDTLVDWIFSTSVDAKPPTKADVYAGYRLLITDMITLGVEVGMV